jgi:glutamyl-tRNA synthetase
MLSLLLLISMFKLSDIPKDIKKHAEECIKNNKTIITRFPPEPSGHLHIGHVKAICVNNGLAKLFNGKIILRFDDTNPLNEKMEYETSIISDLKILKIKPDLTTHTSDYFGITADCAIKLIYMGHAYVDDTDRETMKEERNAGICSKNRENHIDFNQSQFIKMRSGEIQNGCLRLKLDMQSKNKCLRDPVLYRFINAVHYKTDYEYKLYPTYDFSCPIVDSIEGVTHVLRSTEFSDRDEMYYKILDLLKMPKPCIFSYGKVEFEDAVLSKRKIKALIAENKVNDWDDMRLLTIKGIMNAGMSREGLMEFSKSMGFSKKVVKMSLDKLWGINRKIINKISTRFSYVEGEHVVLIVKDHINTMVEIPKFSRNKELGNRNLYRNNKIMISKLDFDSCDNDEEVTLMNWGNMFLNKKDFTLTKHLDGDYKKTKHKILWICNDRRRTITLLKVNGLKIEKNSVLVDNIIDNYENESYIEILKKGYYKKYSDRVFVEINNGKK